MWSSNTNACYSANPVLERIYLDTLMRSAWACWLIWASSSAVTLRAITLDLCRCAGLLAGCAAPDCPGWMLFRFSSFISLFLYNCLVLFGLKLGPILVFLELVNPLGEVPEVVGSSGQVLPVAGAFKFCDVARDLADKLSESFFHFVF